MKKILFWLLIALSSCTVQKINHSLKKSEVFAKGHFGFMLVDPGKEHPLVEINADKYFIPASNTKLFTFYTAYSILGEDSVNGLNYLERGDSLLFWGTGNPSLLHPDFRDETVINFLKSSKKDLYLVDNFDQIEAFGPGWAWDWYNAYYATERSAFPIYGNVVRFKKDQGEAGIQVQPEQFRPLLSATQTADWNGYGFERAQKANLFSYQFTDKPLQDPFQTDVPFITSAEFTAVQLSLLLNKTVTLIKSPSSLNQDPKKLKTALADSLYAPMMKMSDNFLAEQLMLLVSDQLTNTLSTADAIDYAKENLLQDLPDEPIWVDGSGLSSKNMFTPRTIIALLGKIRTEVPLEKIKAYFPGGGESGTIRNWYKADEGQTPYIFAKTGSLSMATSLSGYLITKSGKILHFSSLMNNYAIPSNDLKKELEKVLYSIHDRY